MIILYFLNKFRHTPGTEIPAKKVVRPKKQIKVHLTAVFSLILCTIQAQTISADVKSKIDALFSSYTIPYPGASLLILKNDQVLCNQSYGYADVQNQIRITQHTNFRLASVTKQFTAYCILKMEEEGRLKLTDPLAKYFPGFPSWAEKMTLYQLLNHTSGIYDYEPLISDTVTVPIHDTDVVRLMNNEQRTLFSPGEKFSYSNTGYVLLGLILEQVSGLSFHDCLIRYVYTRAGMSNSSVNEPGAVIPDRAWGYTVSGKNISLTDQSITSYTRGDGAIYTSVKDLMKWDKALNGKSFISESILQKMFKAGPDVINHPEGNKYGMGWFIDEKDKAHVHTGNSNGFTNIYIRYPERGLSIIILSNRTDADLISISRRLRILLATY